MAERPEGWQPIETVPKDGKAELDLWIVNSVGTGYRLTDCHYHCDEWLRYSGYPEIGHEECEAGEARATHWRWPPEPPA